MKLLGRRVYAAGGARIVGVGCTMRTVIVRYETGYNGPVRLGVRP